jgi:hypothetical protein
MLERYKRTFYVTQAVIAVVAAAILYQTRQWQVVAVFFAVMQLAALIGAMWAARLKRKIERGQGIFALR